VRGKAYPHTIGTKIYAKLTSRDHSTTTCKKKRKCFLQEMEELLEKKMYAKQGTILVARGRMSLGVSENLLQGTGRKGILAQVF